MKKYVGIILLSASIAGLSAFGQGYFSFTSGKSQVYDGFSSYPLAPSSRVDVAFLWGAQGAVPEVEALANGVSLGTPQTWTPAAAWTAILADPNFTLAVDNNTGAPAVINTTSNGAISYNSGSAFPVTGTTVGTPYTLFMIGWNSIYATPVLAAAANSFVGWSQAFDYTAASSTSVPNSMNGLTPPFGVVGLIPEPSAITVAGLGGLSIWLLRRRK